MPKLTANERVDQITRETAEKLISMIENGEAGTWMQPWVGSPGGASILDPHNAETGKRYQGFNPLRIAMHLAENGWDSGWVATYKQWKTLGRQVRKGETGVTCIKWVTIRRSEEDANGEEKAKSFTVPKVFSLHAFEQTDAARDDAWEPPVVAPAEVSAWDDCQVARDFFERIGADVRTGGNRAYYAPVQDYIGMPQPEAFESCETYYSTLGHEHVHWTGHESREGRDLKGRFGSENYAVEELVAELGAAVLCGHLGLSLQPRPDHAAYMKSWIKVLRDDPRAILKIAGDAGRAVQHLIDRAEEATPEIPSHPGVALVLAA